MLEVSVLGSHPPKSRPKSRSSTPPPQAKHPFQKCDQYGIKGIQKVRWCWSKNILQKQGGRKNTLVQVEKNFWSQNSLILITFSLLFLKSFALKSFSTDLQVWGKTNKDLFHFHIWLLLDLKKRLPISSVTLFNANKGGENLKNVEVTF